MDELASIVTQTAARGGSVVIPAFAVGRAQHLLYLLSALLRDGRIPHLPISSAVLLVGYQPSGTRGRSLADGADELKIHGQYVPVRAQIRQLDGLSAHADYAEIIDWLRASDVHPRKVFVTHGEPAAADAFRRRLRDQLSWDVVVPDHGSSYPLASR